MASELKLGAVAMVDALGFKGIWKRCSPEKIVEALDSLRTNAIAAAKTADLHVHLFSDTIALGATVKDGENVSGVLEALVNATTEIVVRATLGDPPLLFRGCIAIGQLIATPTVLVGEAVDRAAQGHEQADGAIVWFTEDSSDEWLEWGLSGKSYTILHSDVPLKSGQLYTRAINPLAVFIPKNEGGHPGCAKQYDDYVLTTGSAFERHSDGPLAQSVALKKQHTLEFLEDCRRYLDVIHEIEMEKLDVTRAPGHCLTDEASNTSVNGHISDVPPGPSTTITEHADCLMITMQCSGLFAPGNPQVLPAGEQELARVANIVKQQPNYKNISVEGHTDSIGAADTCLKLSQARAESVGQFLVNAGLPPDHIRAVGKGKSVPVADNSTPDGRALNRRIEIVVRQT